MIDPTPRVSTKSLGGRKELLALKLSELLEECRVSGLAVVEDNALSRHWIVGQIGCSITDILGTPRLHSYLKQWEREHVASLKHVAPTRSVSLQSSDNSNTKIFSSIEKADDGRIVIVPYSLAQNVSTNVPTLIWESGIDVEVSDYLRHLILVDHLSPSSVEKYAKVLRIFVRYRCKSGIKWADVDDNLLLSWQTSMLAADIPVPRRNYCLTIVHGFYRWAELTGRLKYQVCVGRPGDYPQEMFNYKFPISSVEVRARQGRHWKVRWQSPLAERIRHGGYGFRNTPNSNQLLDIFAKASASGRHAVRNHLMMSWALECGARVDELLQPTLEDLPTEDQFWNLNDGEYWAIKLKRKGQKGKEGRLLVTVDLILRTYDYVKHERSEIVRKCNAAGKKVSNYIFLSEKTGGVIKNDSVTKICGEIFRATKVEKANIHRLRAAFITQQVERCLLAVEVMGNSVDMTSTWHETILTMAAELMGHCSVLSLRPYLNQLLIRRLQTELGVQSVNEADAVDASRLQRFATENKELVRAMRLRMQGKFKEAGEILLTHGLEAKRLSENLLPLVQ